MSVSSITPGRLLFEDLEEWRTAINLLLNPPGAQLRQTTLQAIANGTFTPLTFTTEDYDNRNGHSTSSNTSRYVCQVAGRYQLSGKVAWNISDIDGQRASQWYVNGTGVSGSQSSVVPGSTGEREMVATTITVLLAVNDYVELAAFQDSGSSQNTSVANAPIQSTMTIRYVGEA